MKPLKEILSNVLGIDAQSITPETSPDTVSSWDSFNGLMLVSELESAYDISFTTDEVLEVKKVADIQRALQKHGVASELYEI